MFENRLKSPDTIVNKLGSQQREFEDLCSAVNGLGERLTQDGLTSQHSGDLDSTLLRFTKLREALALPTGLMRDGTPVVESDLLAFTRFASYKDINIVENWDVSSKGRIREIRISSISEEAPLVIAALSQLEELAIEKICSHIKDTLDCAPLGDLERLQSLTLSDGSLKDLKFLSKLRTLTALTLDQLELTSLAGVGDLTQLTALSISWNLINDVTVISRLRNLSHLTIIGEKIDDLSPLANLVELVELRLVFLPAQELTFLLKLPKLQRVWLSNDMVWNDRERESLDDLQRAGVVVELI